VRELTVSKRVVDVELCGGGKESQMRSPSRLRTSTSPATKNPSNASFCRDNDAVPWVAMMLLADRPYLR